MRVSEIKRKNERRIHVNPPWLEKNLKTGNLTEFRDISAGLHLRYGEFNMKNLGYAKVSISFVSLV